VAFNYQMKMQKRNRPDSTVSWDAQSVPGLPVKFARTPAAA